ncbi:GyrI-like domain-containing protein [Ammoniphilus sp. YIM 78166]|uniref:GyrI-like domain-containing protein n=1 Tax=Ammoniphilus sp. YIM 78166 TaxID=1644106 RepID=UPI00106FCBF5|nr:effector binding domain-containing protein [Ammoniphilus sp. YIM 78166]
MKLSIINSIRTNNFEDDRLMEKIAGLWKEASGRLANQGCIAYGLYHEYESNYKGDYTLSIALEDNDREPYLEIPKNSRYEIFHVASTEQQGMINTWKEIWRQEETGTLERAYTFDFEKYYPNGKIEVYIAIK